MDYVKEKKTDTVNKHQQTNASFVFLIPFLNTSNPPLNVHLAFQTKLMSQNILGSFLSLKKRKGVNEALAQKYVENLALHLLRTNCVVNESKQ